MLQPRLQSTVYVSLLARSSPSTSHHSRVSVLDAQSAAAHPSPSPSSQALLLGARYSPAGPSDEEKHRGMSTARRRGGGGSAQLPHDKNAAPSTTTAAGAVKTESGSNTTSPPTKQTILGLDLANTMSEIAAIRIIGGNSIQQLNGDTVESRHCQVHPFKVYTALWYDEKTHRFFLVRHDMEAYGEIKKEDLRSVGCHKLTDFKKILWLKQASLEHLLAEEENAFLRGVYTAVRTRTDGMVEVRLPGDYWIPVMQILVHFVSALATLGAQHVSSLPRNQRDLHRWHRACASVPANSPQEYRNAVHDILVTSVPLYDTNNVHLVLEPMASMLYLEAQGRFDSLPSTAHIVLEDIGGGTYDCTAMTRTRTDDGSLTYNVLGYHGDPTLGSERVDKQLLQMIEGWVGPAGNRKRDGVGDKWHGIAAKLGLTGSDMKLLNYSEQRDGYLTEADQERRKLEKAESIKKQLVQHTVDAKVGGPISAPSVTYSLWRGSAVKDGNAGLGGLRQAWAAKQGTSGSPFHSEGDTGDKRLQIRVHPCRFRNGVVVDGYGRNKEAFWPRVIKAREDFKDKIKEEHPHVTQFHQEVRTGGGSLFGIYAEHGGGGSGSLDNDDPFEQLHFVNAVPKGLALYGVYKSGLNPFSVHPASDAHTFILHDKADTTIGTAQRVNGEDVDRLYVWRSEGDELPSGCDGEMVLDDDEEFEWVVYETDAKIGRDEIVYVNDPRLRYLATKPIPFHGIRNVKYKISMENAEFSIKLTYSGQRPDEVVLMPGSLTAAQIEQMRNKAAARQIEFYSHETTQSASASSSSFASSSSATPAPMPSDTEAARPSKRSRKSG